ncbi:MAG: SseB family protein [Actinomycetaceae bacterium]|nr:SseB family protein [Actinomycetaceae bacterium]
MNKPHSFETIQARLNQKVDTTDRGQTLPKTAAALALEDSADRLVALVRAIETERLLAPAVVESGADCESGSVSTIDTRTGPAVVAFTSAQKMKMWEGDARPVPFAGKRVAMLATAEAGGRLVIDPDQDGNGIRVPRPAVVALAHGDSWLPAWQDEELQGALAEFESREIAFARLLPSDSEIQRLAIGVTQYGTTRNRELTAQIHAISALPRLKPAAEVIEILPVPVAAS